MILASTFRLRTGRATTALQRFVDLDRPDDYTIKDIWARADAMGGLLIVETNSFATLLAAAALYADELEIEWIPLVDMNDAIPILQAGQQLEESVRG